MKPKPADKIYVHEISAEELTENFPYHVCYIRKDALLEWAKEMKRICRGAKPIEKAYQTMIDKIEAL